MNAPRVSEHRPDKDLTKCVIVEDGWVHDEIMPSIVEILNELGCFPTIVIRRYLQQIRGDVFLLSHNLRYTIAFAEDYQVGTPEFWPTILRVFSSARFFVINTTAESQVTALMDSPVPTISIWHKPPIFHDPKLSYVARMNNFNMMLARHVLINHWSRLPAQNSKSSIALRDKSDYFMPLYVGDKIAYARSRFGVSESIFIGIPGGVDFSRRNYVKLVEVLTASKALQARLVFVIPGGGAEGRTAIRRLIESSGLGQNFVLAEKTTSPQEIVQHKEYYELLSSCHFCLPLSEGSQLSYNTEKITSSIPTGVGLSTPLLIDRFTKMVYNVDGVVYDENLLLALEEIVHMSAAMFDGLVASISHIRVREHLYGVTSWARALEFLEIKHEK